MIKTNCNVRNKGTDLIVIETKVTMSGEEWDLLHELSNEKNMMDSMFREIASLNPLGKYIYNRYQWKKGTWEVFISGSRIDVPSELSDPEYIEEIARYITLKLTEALAVAIDIEEVNEHVATLTLPDFVVNHLKSHNIAHFFKIDFDLIKERGFNPIVIKEDATSCSNEIIDIINYIRVSTNRLNIPLDNFDTNLKIGYNDEIFIQHTSIRGKDVKDTANKIKTEIQQKIREIEERGDLNLVLAILYKELDYSGSIEIFDEFAIPEIQIKRRYLFDDITVSFKLKTPLIEEFFENKTESEIEVNTDEGKLHFLFNLSAPEQRYIGHIIVPKEVRNRRIERLLKQDVSVIDEVQEIDSRIINQIITGIRTQILDALIRNGIIIEDDSGRYAFNKKYTVEKFRKQNTASSDFYTETSIEVSSTDILDAINEKDREKITVYFVSQKIKNSIEGD
jgi:hypothetical protein